MKSKALYLIYIFPILFLLSLAACDDMDDYSSDPKHTLWFSQDTLRMDTVLTGIPTSTRQLKVYNPHKKALLISSIILADAGKSGFRINVDGKVGETVIIARKNGENWYVGGITSWNPIDYSLDLSFLEEGEWTAEIIKDGVNSNRIGFDYKKQVLTVDTNSKLDFHMAPGGGFAIILTPKN